MKHAITFWLVLGAGCVVGESTESIVLAGALLLAAVLIQATGRRRAEK